MPAFSVEATLVSHLQERLDQMTGEGTQALYHLGFFVQPFWCEAGNHLDSDHVVRLDLHLVHEEAPDVPLAVAGTIPYEMVQDGDTEPLDALLDSLWERAEFLRSIHPLEEHLERVAAEESG